MAGTRISDEIVRSREIGNSAAIKKPENTQTSRPSQQNDLPVKATPVKIIPQSGVNITTLKLFEQTAANMAIQKDPLNIALLIFSRFLSISPDQKLIEKLRREVLPFTRVSPEAIKEKQEAKGLAALIAGDKGVSLLPEAMEHYAHFFGWPEGGKGKHREREKNPDGKEVEAIAEEEAGEDELLDILNKLPGKNGQYWLVFPLNIMVGGIELSIFIRILKSRLSSNLHMPNLNCLIADITGAKKQWRCFLKESEGKFRADIQVYPECGPKALGLLQRKAEKFLGKSDGLLGDFKGFAEITVRSGNEKPSWAEDLAAECLPFVDEKV